MSACGLDFGTSNSAVGVVRDKTAVLAPVEAGSTLMPSAVFFNDCYGYAVFPTVGAGGLVVGGARGRGRVYVKGQYVGSAVMTQLSVGLQAGGKAFSQIIFFQDERAMGEFESGKFEFAAGASAAWPGAALRGRKRRAKRP